MAASLALERQDRGAVGHLLDGRARPDPREGRGPERSRQGHRRRVLRRHGREPELDAAKEPLLLVAKSRARCRNTRRDLSLRRHAALPGRFLGQAGPSTREHRRRTRPARGSIDAIAYANRAYGEQGRAAAPGWKTDRGRIYVRNGTPDDVLAAAASRPVAAVRGVALHAREEPVLHLRRSRRRAGQLTLVHLERRAGGGSPNWQEYFARRRRRRHQRGS